MTKTKKLFATLMALSFSVGVFGLFAERRAASADTDERKRASSVTDGEGPKRPPLLTNLSISIQGKNGTITTTVRNDITVFPSTVFVCVELYSSPTYYESYRDMTLVSSDMTDDLNMYRSISASASTNGQQMYWQGRMRYQINSGEWRDAVTGTCFYTADGVFAGLLYGHAPRDNAYETMK